MTKTNNGIIVWGIIINDVNLISEIEHILQPDFGRIVLKSSATPFNYTDYYENEMGKNLNRLWIVTNNFVSLDKIAEIKHYARKIEDKFRNEQNNRKINLDPGFLTLSNFVLVTTKNYGHRIYLKNGIYAEVTLIFRNKSFQALEWTYPDYREAISFFNEVREYYKKIIGDQKKY